MFYYMRIKDKEIGPNRLKVDMSSLNKDLQTRMLER